MIYDKLSNASRYEVCHKGLDKAFSFLKKLDIASQLVGRCDIDGDNVFALVQSYTTQVEQGRMLEAHRRYIDVQYMVSGMECIGCCALEDTRAQIPYDSEKDCSLHSAEAFGWFRMPEGYMAVFFPEDAHMPCVSDGRDVDVIKVVVKVLVGE